MPIEPKLSMQWFLKMEHLAQIALEPVMKDDIKFYPPKFKNTYRHWMENIKDWCISRQLWWGHRIPAYFLPEGGYVVAETEEKALELAKEKCGNPNLTMSDLRQDEDVLDTWFSSWLWPISLFDGINNPDNEEINYYYPTSDLVTGPDIIFFWVARMIMAGYEYEGQMPFKNVYFTGIVRDKLGRKMSKSLGNSPDPLELIEKYGYGDWGECLTIADPKEVWHFEVFGEGPDKIGGVWAAIRIPDDHVGVSANIPRISKVDPSDKENCMASANVFEVAKRMGFWDGKKPFRFWEAYGGGNYSGELKSFSIREFFILNKLAPSLHLSYDAEELPISVKPENRLT